MLNDKKVLFVIAHPDDELITFGPALMEAIGTAKSVTVVCLTNPSIYRAKKFYDCSRSLGFKPLILGAVDDPEKFITDLHFAEGLHEILMSETPDVIFTHDPVSGDMGCHKHHISCGILVSMLVDNLKSFKPTVYYRYTEGFCEEPVLLRMSKYSYEKALAALAEFYADQAVHLEREKYPLISAAMFGTYSRSFLRKHMLRFYYSEEIPDLDLKYADADPWSVTTSPYELNKTLLSAKFVSENLLANVPSIQVIDIGTGEGKTIRRIVADNPNVSFDITAYDVNAGYADTWGNYTAPNVKSRFVSELEGVGHVDTAFFLQSIYYFKEEEFRDCLQLITPRVIYVESDLFEEHEQVLEELGYVKKIYKKAPLFLGIDDSHIVSDTDVTPIIFVDDLCFNVFELGKRKK